MALSTEARQFAAQISSHDWSDSPWRADRAGHQWSDDSPSRRSARQLPPDDAACVLLNVVWNVAQVLAYNDPNFDVNEFAIACGVARHFTHTKGGQTSGGIVEGLRYEYLENGERRIAPPGIADWQDPGPDSPDRQDR